MRMKVVLLVLWRTMVCWLSLERDDQILVAAVVVIRVHRHNSVVAVFAVVAGICLCLFSASRFGCSASLSVKQTKGTRTVRE